MVIRLFTNVVGILAICQIVLSKLEVKPFMLAETPGGSVKFVCSDPENETIYYYVKWTVRNTSLENSTRDIPTYGRIRAVNGTLNIDNVTYDDANTYTCQYEDNSNTAVLKVYDMPDYMMEGIIIAGICLILLLTLLMATFLSLNKQKRQRKQRLLESDLKISKKKPNHKLHIND
uniref:Ig-like domain-containing protein n=1 Tax=Arion vulgaris TaxID=1028688 RepID=A0A0B7AXX7_9EUPU